MFDKERSGIDRRSGADRRRVFNVDYWLSGGLERRRWRERRSEFERRAEWARVTQWCRVFTGDLKI